MTDHANELRRHARKIPHPQGETPGVMLRAADEIERLQSVIASPHNMTRDDVIRMAREAGISDTAFDFQMVSPEDLERFAALIAAAEREACAVICDELHNQWRWGADDPHSGPADCAAAIRSRGNQ